jgi:outer membrane immunogenic protein
MGAAATQADAQALSGVRVEAQVGADSFHADGGKHSKIGFGAAAGYDFNLGGFVLGPEVTYWRAFNEVRTVDGGGLAEHKSFQEWGLALRGGVAVTPSTLIYGKVGYVRNEQRKRFTVIDAAGNLNSGLGYYYDHHTVGGWQWGAGVNQGLGGGFYASLEGRYSDYKAKYTSGGTHRLVGLVGLGYKFGATPEAAPPPPPPPPPPPAPATQTCPDGSVIDAAATCPAPPPPPPPPAPAPERG